MTKKREREETLMRIVVGIVSGIVLYVWMYLIGVFFIINWIYTLIEGKKISELSKLSEVWNVQVYHFIRYMTFTVNERPFPLSDLKKL